MQNKRLWLMVLTSLIVLLLMSSCGHNTLVNSKGTGVSVGFGVEAPIVFKLGTWDTTYAMVRENVNVEITSGATLAATTSKEGSAIKEFADSKDKSVDGKAAGNIGNNTGSTIKANIGMQTSGYASNILTSPNANEHTAKIAEAIYGPDLKRAELGTNTNPPSGSTSITTVGQGSASSQTTEPAVQTQKTEVTTTTSGDKQVTKTETATTTVVEQPVVVTEPVQTVTPVKEVVIKPLPELLPPQEPYIPPELLILDEKKQPTAKTLNDAQPKTFVTTTKNSHWYVKWFWLLVLFGVVVWWINRDKDVGKLSIFAKKKPKDDAVDPADLPTREYEEPEKNDTQEPSLDSVPHTPIPDKIVSDEKDTEQAAVTTSNNTNIIR